MFSVSRAYYDDERCKQYCPRKRGEYRVLRSRFTKDTSTPEGVAEDRQERTEIGSLSTEGLSAALSIGNENDRCAGRLIGNYLLRQQDRHHKAL